MAGNRVKLRPIFPDDMEFLYQLAIDSEVGWRWRYRAHIPDFETFVRQLWGDVLVQVMIESASTGERLGLAVAYGPDHRNGFVFLGILITPAKVTRGIGVEAYELFLAYLRKAWSFRKYYAEVPAFNYPQIKSGEGRWFRIEAVYDDHLYYDERTWDLYILTFILDRRAGLDEG